ncbi:MAG: CapA family protein [Nocardioidaceae bacterium]|nr:CapA family protein [Nocardioidaceae bacterium]
MQRPRIDIPVRRARRIAAGAPTTWAEIGQPGGRIDIRTGPGALRAVERDADVLAVAPASRLRPTVMAATVGGVDPLRDPGDYALNVDAPTAMPAVTTVTVAGDIMLGRAVAVAAAAAGDVAAPLGPMRRRLAGADITVGNLESTLSQAGPPEQGGDSFAAPPSVLDGLDEAGFDLLSLGNNHTGDYGDRALLQTIERLRQSPIESVGAGRDARHAWRPVVLRRNGISFGFVAFNAIGETPRATRGQPGAAEVRMQPRTGPLDRGDLRRLTTTIDTLSRRVDVVVAMPHWGDQYTYEPVPDQRRVGRAMIDAGADIVVGGHPHWTQGIQLRHRQLVVHSLGNFVFDMDFSTQTQEGVLLELVFWGSELKGARFVPYVIGPDYAPRRAFGLRAEAILSAMWAASDPPLGPE